MFTCWKNGRPYLQANFREPGRKHPRSVCASLGSLDTARERLAEILADEPTIPAAKIPDLIDRLVSHLEATWTPAAEAKRVLAQLKRLYESACHPEVRGQLALAWDALEKLAAGAVVSKET